MFGSPFMRNASIIIGLIVGMIVAGATGYVDSSSIDRAPAVTFLWVKRFKLGVYGPAVLPSLAVYVVLAMEAIGDITASADLSRVTVDGVSPCYVHLNLADFEARIRQPNPRWYSRRWYGRILLCLVHCHSHEVRLTHRPRLTTSIFAQNNGVIALTRCANRKAGFVCASFLILYGVLGKLSGVFLSIPNPVLGGVTTFLNLNDRRQCGYGTKLLPPMAGDSIDVRCHPQPTQVRPAPFLIHLTRHYW